ncbi:MAG: glycosyltransferase family 4 protein [Bryobacterales bacterium]|nr:glycosyltransferase family 4 protein [Bryobacterales bacterium]
MTPETILLVHNRYREPGGEDQVFRQEAELLRTQGHRVHEYVESNEDLDEARPITTGLEAIWSRRAAKVLQGILRETRPDVAHFHNTFGRISPAAYYACRRAGVPVVQTLHNYRLGCLNACCSREGRNCEACVSKLVPWEGLLHRCYRGSATASLAMAGIGTVHRAMGTYRRKVDAFISTSHFARQIHVRSGIPEQRSYVKPNFTAEVAGSARPRRRAVLFAGRICREKGIHVLLEAWRLADLTGWELVIAGDGPDFGASQGAASGVRFLGRVPQEHVAALMQVSTCLVQPALVWENCGLVILEALAAGLPIVASGHGSFAELVTDGTGWLFRPGDAYALAGALREVASAPDAALERMGEAARAVHRTNFSASASYRKLAEIYERVCRS